MKSLKASFFLVGAIAALSALLVACGGSDKPSATVDADLTEWSVKPSTTEVNAGTIKFAGHNKGTQVHEIALITLNADGSRHEIEDHEGLKPGESGDFTVKNLKAGKYELVCLLAPGQFGSTVDHYQQGMHTEFTVK
jgi:uncharacterized cupredoxin-like copper-binding protein